MKNKIKLPRVAQVGGDRATHNTKAKGLCRRLKVKLSKKKKKQVKVFFENP